MENCEYQKVCKFYSKNCDDKDYQESCWINKTLDGLLNREVLKARINKQIYRSEHGHRWYENEN